MYRTITFAYTPEPIKEFFDEVRKIEEKISRGDKSYIDDINRMNDDSQIERLTDKYEKK
jgi:hypothetical protein